MNRRRHPRLPRFATRLLLVALLLHALVPAGFMPAVASRAPAAAGWLAICPASELAVALKARADGEAPPTGPICHGGRQADAAADDALRAQAAARHDPHAGAPAGDAGRLSDHGDCPFAQAGAALPPAAGPGSATPAAPLLAIGAATCAAPHRRLHRRPPSRGPPLSFAMLPLQG
ncbi:MAG: hypothetical protein C0434_10865 [Xanthomonadaceae bacterium]|nr:hypothetical protein [Xanthomonadaceae bacterium]